MDAPLDAPQLELSCELKLGKVVAGFRLGRQIGFGGFAKVFTAEQADTRRKAAVKAVRKPRMKARATDSAAAPAAEPSASEVNLARTYNECKVLGRLCHDNIVGLIDWVETKRHVYIITELAEDGDLLDYIRLFGPLSEKQLGNVFVSLVDALRYAHANGYAHLDVKPENVLLHEDRVLLADWGFATPIKTTPAGLRWVGTRGYAAPEILRHDVANFDARRADCWSLGVTLYALAAGKLAFDTRNPDVDRKILNGEYEIPAHFPAPLRKVIEGLIQVDPAKRLTLAELRASEFYALSSATPAAAKRAPSRALPRSRAMRASMPAPASPPHTTAPMSLPVPRTPDGSACNTSPPPPPPTHNAKAGMEGVMRNSAHWGQSADEALIELDLISEKDLPALDDYLDYELGLAIKKQQQQSAEPRKAGGVLGLARRLIGLTKASKERR